MLYRFEAYAWDWENALAYCEPLDGSMRDVMQRDPVFRAEAVAVEQTRSWWGEEYPTSGRLMAFETYDEVVAWHARNLLFCAGSPFREYQDWKPVMLDPMDVALPMEV